jgi:hypothetical protein
MPDARGMRFASVVDVVDVVSIPVPPIVGA